MRARSPRAAAEAANRARASCSRRRAMTSGNALHALGLATAALARARATRRGDRWSATSRTPSRARGAIRAAARPVRRSSSRGRDAGTLARRRCAPLLRARAQPEFRPQAAGRRTLRCATRLAVDSDAALLERMVATWSRNAVRYVARRHPRIGGGAAVANVVGGRRRYRYRHRAGTLRQDLRGVLPGTQRTRKRGGAEQMGSGLPSCAAWRNRWTTTSR